MSLYKPAGPGPFAAAVLLHGCAGPRRHLSEWAAELLRAKMAVLILDSLTQRGVRNNCRIPLRVTTINGALDAFRALEHLAAQPYVDAGRVALIGFSWGGMAALLAARPELAERLPRERPRLRFRAVVALYPHCRIPAFPTPLGLREIEYLAETDRALLVLMGGRDEETPARICLPRLEALKARGAPVEWQVFPDATHAFDIEEADGYTTPTLFGRLHSYRYDPHTAAAARRRAIAFLERELKK